MMCYQHHYFCELAIFIPLCEYSPSDDLVRQGLSLECSKSHHERGTWRNERNFIFLSAQVMPSQVGPGNPHGPPPMMPPGQGYGQQYQPSGGQPQAQNVPLPPRPPHPSYGYGQQQPYHQPYPQYSHPYYHQPYAQYSPHAMGRPHPHSPHSPHYHPQSPHTPGESGPGGNAGPGPASNPESGNPAYPPAPVHEGDRPGQQENQGDGQADSKSGSG